MRFIKILFLVLVAICAVILAVANRGPVTLHLWPDGMILPEAVAAWPSQVTLPIYAAALIAVFVGILVGVVMELLRESGHRRRERQFEREAARLQRENKRLAKKAGEDEDDILGLKA